MASLTPLTCWKTAWTPQKHPPATTAVSFPFFAASGASTVGSGRPLVSAAWTGFQTAEPTKSRIAATIVLAFKAFHSRIIATPRIRMSVNWTRIRMSVNWKSYRLKQRFGKRAAESIPDWMIPEPLQHLIGAFIRRKYRIQDMLDASIPNDHCQPLQKPHAAHHKSRQSQGVA